MLYWANGQQGNINWAGIGIAIWGGFAYLFGSNLSDDCASTVNCPAYLY